MDLKKLVRPNILNLKSYSNAREEFKGEARVYLDANENPYNSPINRYPDPLQWEVKSKIAQIKGIDKEWIFLGNGSDEPIDLVYRAFCEPNVDNVVAIHPSYGMYQVCAEINNVGYHKVNLNDEFQLNVTELLTAADDRTKVIFLCTPNNPTANSLKREDVIQVIESFQGLVVIDEAYIDFSKQASFIKDLMKYENLMIIQTFSKAWGAAAIRLGMAFAHPELIAILNKIKYPYNVNILTQKQVLKLMENQSQVESWIAELIQERDKLDKALRLIPYVNRVYPSDANFILVRVGDANAVYDYLMNKGIIIRNRNKISLCQGCLRITIGTPEENKILIEALKLFTA